MFIKSTDYIEGEIGAMMNIVTYCELIERELQDISSCVHEETKKEFAQEIRKLRHEIELRMEYILSMGE